MKKIYISSWLVLFIFVMNNTNVFSEDISLFYAIDKSHKVNKGLAHAKKKIEAKESAVTAATGKYYPNIALDFSVIHLNDEIGMSLDPIRQALIALQSNDQVSLANLQNMITKGAPLTPEQMAIVSQQAQATYNKLLPEFYSKLKPQTYPLLTLTVTQPIFTGLKIPNAVKATKAQKNIEVVNYDQAVSNLDLEVIKSYLSLLLAEANMKVRQDVRDGIYKHQQRAEKLLETGLIQVNQKLRADVGLANAEKNLFAAKELANIARIALASVLDMSSENLEVTDSLKYFDFNEDIQPFLAKTQEKNTNIKKLNYAKEALQAKSNIEFADYLPTIGAFGSYQFIEKGLSTLDPKWVIGAKASWTLFNGLERRNKYQAAKLEVEAINDMQKEVSRKLALLVRKQYLEMQVAKKTYKMLEATLIQGEENLLAATKRFETGLGTSFDVIDATLQLEGIKLNRLKALKDYYMNIANLYNTSSNVPDFLTFWSNNQ